MLLEIAEIVAFVGHNFSNSQNEDGRNKKASVCLLHHQRTCEQIK